MRLRSSKAETEPTADTRGSQGDLSDQTQHTQNAQICIEPLVWRTFLSDGRCFKTIWSAVHLTRPQGGSETTQDDIQSLWSKIGDQLNMLTWGTGTFEPMRCLPTLNGAYFVKPGLLAGPRFSEGVTLSESHFALVDREQREAFKRLLGGLSELVKPRLEVCHGLPHIHENAAAASFIGEGTREWCVTSVWEVKQDELICTDITSTMKPIVAVDDSWSLSEIRWKEGTWVDDE